MIRQKYQGATLEVAKDGTSRTETWYGSRVDMEALARELASGSARAEGAVSRVRVSQGDGDFWECEATFTSGSSVTLVGGGGAGQGGGGGAGNPTPPDTAYGKRSATLKGGMLSLPLERHPRYRTRWNHWLAAAPGVTAVPGWWETHSAGGGRTDTYAWLRDVSELPTDPATNRPWTILKPPAKPGVESYDMATYAVTESARFQTAAAAGRMVAGKLNSIGQPSNNFGIAGGNWKCDDAQVAWTGKYWLATLTWTRSGDSRGWDSDLY